MREIKFRGKDKQGRWWKGDLRHTMMELGKPHCRIVNVDKDDYDRLQEIWSDPIQEDTIGQFTGFYNRKRQEIYEGDIITYLNHRIDGTGFIEQGKVEWRQEEGCYVFVNRFPTKDNRELVMPLIHCKEITVIGNIHDNPELMKGGAK